MKLKSIQKVSVFLFFVLVLSSSVKAQYNVAERLNDSVCFESTEVEVGAWLSFYSWVLENEGYLAALKVLPDSTAIDPDVWRFMRTKADVYNEQPASTEQPLGFIRKDCPASGKYGDRLISVRNGCAFINLPITGISYQQAIAYCKWKTVVQGKGRYTYRLPSEEEWVAFANQGFSDAEKARAERDSITASRCSLFNYKTIADCKNARLVGLCGVGMYAPEKTGAFDLFGNVSEMTSTEGCAKGGNFLLYASRCRPDSTQYYSKPQPWLGLRCVVVKSGSVGSISVDSVLSTSMLMLGAGKGQFVDTRDGQKYLTVKIGNQVWLAENLKYKPLDGKYWIPEREEKNIKWYGYLYSYQAAQNVCPDGWELPSKEDFDTLLNHASVNWSSKNLLASGNSGFSALIGGSHMGTNYVPSGYGISFWSKTESSNNKIWLMGVRPDNPKVLLIEFKKKSSYGFPVRCIKK